MIVDPESEYIAPVATSTAPVKKKIIGSKWLSLIMEFIGNTYNIALGAFVSSILYPWIGWPTILIMALSAIALKYSGRYVVSKINKVFMFVLQYKASMATKKEVWVKDEFKADDER